MRFHIVGIAHTQTTPEYCHCAYTMKVWNMCRMLTSLGYEVVHYGTEGSDASICTEHVDVVDWSTLREYYSGYGEDQFFKYDTKDDPVWTQMRERLPDKLKEHVDPDDVLLVVWGKTQYPICSEAGLANPVVEFGVGYTGVCANYRVFESYAWMHHVYGLLDIREGKWFDTVIQNSYDPAHFEFCEEKDDYFFYIGRVIQCKGPEIASQVAKTLGKKLVIAGQTKNKNGEVMLPRLLGEPHVEYVGPVGVEERKRLLGKASAVFVPTHYIEPFGGTNVEAQMCGTPVITTDWGGFSETVLHGVTGFRCRTFNEFVQAAQHIDEIDPKDCRDWAIDNFSIWNVRFLYEGYYRQVHDHGCNDGGWYSRYEDFGGWRQRYRRAYPSSATKKALVPSGSERRLIGQSVSIVESPPPKTRPFKDWVSAQEHESDYWDNPKTRDCEKRKHKKYLKMLDLDLEDWSDVSLLEVGGGPESLLRLFRKAGRRVVIDPIDFTEDYASDEVEFICGMGETVLPMPEQFDAVFLLNVLEHTHDPNRIVHLAWESVKVNGILYLCEPVWPVVGVNMKSYKDAHIHEIHSGWLISELSGLDGAKMKRVKNYNFSRRDGDGGWMSVRLLKTASCEASVWKEINSEGA